MIGKKIGVAICFATIIAQASAQEFGIELSGGLQGTYYPLKNGQTKLLPAGSLGLNYTFRLSSHLGLLTGITGGLYRTEATLLDGRIFTYGEVDDAGSAFRYRIKFTSYKETQHFFAASIPLLLQYHTNGPGTQWYINGGAKLFLPFNANSKISAQQVSLTGYYPDFNVEVSDMPQHGFGTLTNWNSNTTTKLKPTALLSAATGISFRLSRRSALYTGLFVDFGLTHIKADNDSLSLVTYSSKGIDGARANSVLNSDNAGEVKLHSYGLQIRLTFGASRSGAKSVARPKTKPAPQDTLVSQHVPIPQPVTTSRPAPVSQPVPTPQPATASQHTPSPTLSNDEAEIIHRPITFGILGEASIPEVQRPHLDEVANLLKKYPNIRISIVGHYCNSETETEDRKVGEARAKAVARYLQDKGISRKRMRAGAAVEKDPARSGDPGANFFSRRVIITTM